MGCGGQVDLAEQLANCYHTRLPAYEDTLDNIAGVIHLKQVVHLLRDGEADPDGLRSIAGILRGVESMQSESIVQLGLLLLIATPVARVAFTLVAFMLQRDRTYVAVTALVLALLLFGLLFGHA